MSAKGIERAIDAFIEGDMDFAQLRRVIEIQVGRNPARSGPARARLDALKQAGRMSHSLHGILSEELERSAYGEVTVAAENTEPDETVGLEPPATAVIEPTQPDERPVAQNPRPVEAGARPPPLAVAGEVLAGRYALESVLGRGGMSVVFRARDLHMPEDDPKARGVAVKVLTPEFAGRDDARAALGREAAYARRLGHAGLVRVFDADLQGPLPFVVMELLEGEHLRSLLVRRYPNPLPPAEALPLIREVASILAHVHAAGLVHRDVKPANVFLCPDGQVRLMDLGLAGPRGELPGDTGTMRARTPAYSPPSALEGEAPVPADDVYALGCMAYEMLAGRHPFGKLPGNEAASRGATVGRIESLEPGRWQALRRSLEFDAARRQPSAREFLEEFFAPPPAPRPARPWAAGGILAGLLAGLAVGWMAPPPAAVVARVKEWTAAAPSADEPVARPAEPAASASAEPAGATTPGKVSGDMGAGDLPGTVAGIPADAAPDGSPAAEESSPVEADAGAAMQPGAPSPPGEEATGPAEPPPPAPDSVAAETDAVADAAAEPAPAAPGPPAAPARLSLPAGPVRVSEGETALKVPLPRPTGWVGPLRVEWRTLEGTALDGDDFAGADWQEVEAPAGVGSLVLYVPIVSDALAEPPEVFFVEIRRAPGGPEPVAPLRLQVVITDDD